ncbi:MAG: sel1 repeat family protein [Lachnospiraceae bacterium]|nr:sel1 repeat family protein [Lachnospiraceae bacterium]
MQKRARFINKAFKMNRQAQRYEEKGDKEMAYRCYLENALTGTDGKSLYELGKKYLLGDFVDFDYDKAGHYFKMAYEVGYKLPAGFYIVIACYEKKAVNATWDSEMKWYQLAVDEGCEYGYECMGNMYMEKGDYKKAIELFLTPTKNESLSLYSLGKIYEEGLGVEKDMDKAIEYYRRTIIECDILKDKGDEHYEKAKSRLMELGVGV